MPELEIRAATERDVPLILTLIKELAKYERLSHEVVATEEALRDSLFGERRVAEALLGYLEDDPAGFALFFHNFSTFLGKPGIYLEDLYVRPEFRSAGVGRALLVHLAGLARSETAGGWSGRCWTGTSQLSASTRVLAPPQ
jgi:GNAT superfamily N-acetyltransferase